MKRSLSILWYVVTLKCEEADRLRAIGRPADLRWWERWAEWLHALGCKSCWRARRQLDKLRELADRAAQAERSGDPAAEGPGSAGLSPAARDRMRAKLGGGDEAG